MSDNKEYILEKLSIKDGMSSGVGAGQFSLSSSYLVFSEKDQDENGKIKPRENPNFSEIKPGDQILVYESLFRFLRTSPITKIIEVSDNELKFETISSSYSLRIFSEDNNEDDV